MVSPAASFVFSSAVSNFSPKSWFNNSSLVCAVDVPANSSAFLFAFHKSIASCTDAPLVSSFALFACVNIPFSPVNVAMLTPS